MCLPVTDSGWLVHSQFAYFLFNMQGIIVVFARCASSEQKTHAQKLVKSNVVGRASSLKTGSDSFFVTKFQKLTLSNFPVLNY